jgi:Tol biopolymer transport system component
MPTDRRRVQPRVSALVLVAVVIGACSPTVPHSPSPGVSRTPVASPHPSASSFPATASATRLEHRSDEVVAIGEPIHIDDLSGRILFDDFDDVFAMDVDGSNLVTVAGDPSGPEFDGAWSPDGRWVVYRDSTRGINENDEIFVARADGSDRRNLTNHPANDWGPDWSPDGRSIIFNSDREGGPLRGYLMDPDGSNLRALNVSAWVEYASFSPDGTRISFMSALGNNYELFVADLASGAVTRLTDSPGHDAWNAWSPDGSTIAFSSHRDDCGLASPDRECWRTPHADDEHHDIWLIEADGSDLRRVTPELGQFVTWSPDGDYLLISGRALFVVRPDGTGRLELRAEGIDRALGGIPDWR